LWLHILGSGRKAGPDSARPGRRTCVAIRLMGTVSPIDAAGTAFAMTFRI